MAGPGVDQESGRQRPTVYLLDGTYTVFRSYYAIPALTAPDGTPTGGVYGFLSTVRKLLRERKPDHFGAAFDLEGPTHRDEIFADYKANRAAPPEQLLPQFPLAMEACRVMGWPVITADGFEADDVIGTLAQQALDQNLAVVIVTADKDLYQLVGENVSVLNPSKDDLLLDAKGVEQLFGAPPERVVDVLALMGDKVDNIPGVPGIGEKGAKRLIKRYGGLEAILERAHHFAELWRAHEEAWAALEAGDRQTLAEGLERLSAPAEWLATLEASLGGEAGEDLAARFSAAASLAGRREQLQDRQIKRALKDLEKKTQPKAWLSLADNEEGALFSRRLATISRDAPVSLDLEAMRPGQPRPEEAVSLLSRLGFRRLSEEMSELAGETAVVADALEVEVISELDRLQRMVEEYLRQPLVAVDTETTSLEPRKAKLVGISLAAGPGGGVYVPVLGPEGTALDWSQARELLRPLLEEEDPPKTGQNLKFDRAVLREAGLTLRGIGFDTLIAAQLLEPGRGISHKLEDLAWRHLGLRMISYGEVAGRGDGERTLDQVDVETVARYAAEDAVVAWRLTEALSEELEKEQLLELLDEIELPLVEILDEMESRGIRVDVEQLARMSVQLEQELLRLEAEIHEIAGHPFNIASPQQLRRVLFEELGLDPTGRKTQKTKVHSTGQEALEALSAVHPLPAKVLEYRELAKLKSTYVDALPRLVDPETGRLHTQFHQLGAATGRLSSSDPNLQNIPVRTPLGRRIREAFVPAPGQRLISADYSQMELRVLAHMAGDPVLIEAFRKGLDIHRYTAALVAGIEMEEVTDELRSAAKAVNFGIIYGMSEFRLAREQGMSRDQARAFIAAYFERSPKVKEYIEAVKEQVRAKGEVRTLYGRRRSFAELHETGAVVTRINRAQREQLLRQAVNTTVQGTAADIVKLAMVRVYRALREQSLEASLLLQVHDELLLEAPPSELERLETLVREAMEGAAELSVPLKVDLRWGESWAAIH